jgi:hypothetical protein
MPREGNRDDRSGDLFGKLKADVRVTRQTRKRSAAETLRILFVTGREFCQRRDLLVEHKNREPPSRWREFVIASAYDGKRCLEALEIPA